MTTVTQDASAMLPGAVIGERKRCGKPSCRCASRRQEDLHGPYFYRYFRQNGRLRKEYVPKDRVDQVREACMRHRENQRAHRERKRRFLEQAKTVDETLRTIETLWKN